MDIINLLLICLVVFSIYRLFYLRKKHGSLAEAQRVANQKIAESQIILQESKDALQAQKEALTLNTEKREAMHRIYENRKNGIACCPKCGTTSLSANKKGFGVGKGIIGASIAGPIGLVAGNIGSQNVLITCLYCGHRFKPGKK